MTVFSPLRLACILGGALILASCGPKPTPQPLPPPLPQPPTPVVVTPLSADWREWPVAAGDWSYRTIDGGSLASFGAPGQPAQLMLRCDVATHRISVSRTSTAPAEQIVGQMMIRTTAGDAQWPVLPGGAPGAATRLAVATRAAVDGVFDRMIFSRGRFAVEAPGAQPIVVPTWAEVARVIEDCRG